MSSACPFHPSEDSPPPSAQSPRAIEPEFAFLQEADRRGAVATTVEHRLALCRHALAEGQPAPLTSEELTWASRIAWRNHSRCIGRLYWEGLQVRDCRDLTRSEDLFESLVQHLTLATNDGNIRPVMTIFRPAQANGGAPRIWNHQLCGYAGYRNADGSVLGDPANLRITERALALGWWPTQRSAFDLLPWMIEGAGEAVRLFQLPLGLVREVRLRHPTHAWFENLGLRWYAVPVISDMRFHAAGTDFPAAPFSGWYMGTEIGARNLADRDRYNFLPSIADRLGLDRSTPRSLWLDRALVELNTAVLYSYAADGIKIVDHHTASAEFLRFCEREKNAGRDVSARWDWIVPPLSPAATGVFHRPMTERPSTPDFHPQAPAF